MGKHILLGLAILLVIISGCCRLSPEPSKLTCYDGTYFGTCSHNQPRFCQDGILVDNATLCGCPGGKEIKGDGCAPIPTCEDGTPYGLCSANKPSFCQDGELVNKTSVCGCPEGQVVHGEACGYPRPVTPRQNYTFTSYEDTEPYLSMYCEKINPYDLSVRQAAADAIRKHPGAYDLKQLFDIYDWVKANVIYQNVPLAGVPYPPSDTLITRSGDCKNQAVLISSMVRAIGGKTKVVLDPSCKHAYAIVYFGPPGSEKSALIDAVGEHYGSDVYVNYFTNSEGVWVIFDPAGGDYPGDTLPECTGKRTIYFVNSCLDCVNTYPSSPYTYNDKCYSSCPSGTITSGQHLCAPCPSGYQSCNNQCLTCPSGSYLTTGCTCYRYR